MPNVPWHSLLSPDIIISLKVNYSEKKYRSLPGPRLNKALPGQILSIDTGEGILYLVCLSNGIEVVLEKEDI